MKWICANTLLYMPPMLFSISFLKNIFFWDNRAYTKVEVALYIFYATMSYRSAIFKLTGAADRIQPIAEAKGTQGIYTAPVRLLRCNALTYIYFIRPSARYEFCKSPGAKHMEMKNYLHFFFRLPPPIRASVDSCNFDVYTWRCISSVSRKFRMRLLYPPPPSMLYKSIARKESIIWDWVGKKKKPTTFNLLRDDWQKWGHMMPVAPAVYNNELIHFFSFLRWVEQSLYTYSI